MATAVASRLSRGRSLLGGLTNALSGLMNSSSGMMNGSIHTQQQRTFIQMGTKLKVVDNSGAKEVMCIQSLKGKKGARLGDVIVGSVKDGIPKEKEKKGKDAMPPKAEVKKGKDALLKNKVKKGMVVYGVVVRAAMPKRRADGSEVKFDDNAVVIVGIKDKKKKIREFNQPIGTRVFGPVPHEMRLRKQLKILSLAQHLV